MGSAAVTPPSQESFVSRGHLQGHQSRPQPLAQRTDKSLGESWVRDSLGGEGLHLRVPCSRCRPQATSPTSSNSSYDRRTTVRRLGLGQHGVSAAPCFGTVIYSLCLRDPCCQDRLQRSRSPVATRGTHQLACGRHRAGCPGEIIPKASPSGMILHRFGVQRMF